MERMIQIDDKVIRLKAHAGIPILYKQNFQSDFFADVFKLGKSLDGLNESNDFSLLEYEQIDHIDMDVLYNMIWIFAKAGDKEIEPLVEWLSQFDSMPLDEILTPVMELMTGLMKRKK